MAKKKFTQLPAAGALTGTEIVAVVQSGVSKQTTAQAIANLGGGGGGSGVPTDWDFATSGASPGDFPTDLTLRYYTIDDSVFPFGTEFWTNGSGGWYTK